VHAAPQAGGQESGSRGSRLPASDGASPEQGRSRGRDAVSRLMGRLDAASVQFGLAQVAFDCYAGKPEVAQTRAEQITKAIDARRREIEDLCGRLGQLDESVRGQFLPWWKRAGKEMPRQQASGPSPWRVGALSWQLLPPPQRP
jgi:hypothetical protein